ncbi:hypothetical protein GCM10010448_14450 [Streptomyces glomeratus]|uniref:Uncharacterized protein n=1 Tax=Streptomyces glomeratus TaxID=284452 RepID=A0ABP6L5W3_9ACTN
MQVEMGLRQLSDITYVLHPRILPHLPGVPVAVSPDVVLLAQTKGARRVRPPTAPLEA